MERDDHGSTRRVLVVDDNVDSADTVAMLLRKKGHQVDTAHDGRQTLERARDFRPHAVVLDIGLPGMTGHEVARALRDEHGGGLVLIALTGYGQASDRENTRDAGFDHHMLKPVDIRALHDVICGPS